MEKIWRGSAVGTTAYENGRTDLQRLFCVAQGGVEWRDVVKEASDTYGH